MDIYTVAELREVLKTATAVYVTSTILMGGGVSLKTSKAEVERYIKGRDGSATASGTDGVTIFYDNGTGELYI